MSKFILEITPSGCDSPFNKYGIHSTDDTLLKTDPASVKLVVFTGGADVTPELYGENVGRYTSFNTKRDLYETKMFELALKHKIPVVGICRGSQFVCVMSGGKLVQDITNHGGHHTIRTHKGDLITVNSTHHQMQRPSDTARILAVADPRRSKHYHDGDNKPIEMTQEIEAVYYPNINALGIQWHPEWLGKDHPAVIYTQQLVEEFLLPQ